MQDSVIGADHARPLPGGLSAMNAKACHEAHSALQVEFLLCYAMAGGHVRFCMLCRDDPDSCVVLSGDHNIYSMRGRLQLLRLAVLLYRILAIQQTQLPSDATGQ